MVDQSASNEALHTAMTAAALTNTFTPATAVDLADQVHHDCPYPEHTLEVAQHTIRILDAWADDEIWDDDAEAETALLGDAHRELNTAHEEGELATVGDVADWLGWWARAYEAYVASGGDPAVHDAIQLGELEDVQAAAGRARAEENVTDDVATDVTWLTDDLSET
jgi:hypothetical protein